MAKKDKRATDQLNVALSGIDSALTVMLSVTGNDDGPMKRLIEAAREHCGEARDALITIQFHSAQI
jgi:hypothetical protein